MEGFRDGQRIIFKIVIGFEGEGEFDVLGLIGISCNFKSLKTGQELTVSAIPEQIANTSKSSMLGFSNEDSKKNSNYHLVKCIGQSITTRSQKLGILDTTSSLLAYSD